MSSDSQTAWKDMSSDSPQPSSWESMMNTAYGYVKRLDATYGHLLNQVKQVKQTKAGNRDMSIMEQLLSHTAPLTEEEHKFAFFVKFMYSFSETEFTTFLFKSRRQSLLLLINEDAIVKALKSVGVLNVVKVDNKYSLSVNESALNQQKTRVKNFNRPHVHNQLPLMPQNYQYQQMQYQQMQYQQYLQYMQAQLQCAQMPPTQSNYVPTQSNYVPTQSNYAPTQSNYVPTLKKPYVKSHKNTKPPTMTMSECQKVLNSIENLHLEDDDVTKTAKLNWADLNESEENLTTLS